ncbi:MAG: radical SAM family heme chaperone HemW [Pseudomonadota bacterium]
MAGPRHLYIHVPFCRSRCVYCAFYSTTTIEPSRLDRFCDALLTEARFVVGGGPWETVYLGGGTPSLLGVDRVTRLLCGLRASTPFATDAEVTLEANPEGLGTRDADAFLDAGVTRLSLGVQSFHDDDLRLLGRPHDGATARRAVAGALGAGLRVGLDLIYGLPGRSSAHWLAQLDAAADTGVEHLSAYELSVEPGTPLAAAWPDGLGDRAELFFRTHEHLASLGFEGYEVSNFARTPAGRSRHNLATWAHRTYRGLGPGAHSFLEGRGGPTRRWNLPDLGAWLAALEENRTPMRGREVLSPEQRLLERVMLGVRTRAGVDLTACRRECGDALTDGLLARIDDPVERGLLILADNHLRPTLQGMALADRLAVELSS